MGLEVVPVLTTEAEMSSGAMSLSCEAMSSSDELAGSTVKVKPVWPTLKLTCCPTVEVRFSVREVTASKAQRSVAASCWISMVWLPAIAEFEADTDAKLSSEMDAALLLKSSGVWNPLILHW